MFTWRKIIKICKKNPQIFKGLESKKKRLNIDDGKGRLVDQLPFTSFTLTINYEVKIHANVDDVDICFIV
jgi:hypothetical protein